MCFVNQYISLCVHWYVFFPGGDSTAFLLPCGKHVFAFTTLLAHVISSSVSRRKFFQYPWENFFFYIKWCVLLFFIDLPLWFRHEHLIPHLVYRTPQRLCCRCVSSSFFDLIFAQHLCFFVSHEHVAWRSPFAIDVWTHRFTFHCILCLRHIHLVIYANAAMHVSSLSFVRSWWSSWARTSSAAELATSASCTCFDTAACGNLSSFVSSSRMGDLIPDAAGGFAKAQSSCCSL